MRTVDIAEATGPLAEYVLDAGNEPLVVTRKGKPIAAVLSVENTDWETLGLSTHPDFVELIRASRAAHAEKGGIPAAEMRRRLGL